MGVAYRFVPLDHDGVPVEGSRYTLIQDSVLKVGDTLRAVRGQLLLLVLGPQAPVLGDRRAVTEELRRAAQALDRAMHTRPQLTCREQRLAEVIAQPLEQHLLVAGRQRAHRSPDDIADRISEMAEAWGQRSGHEPTVGTGLAERADTG